MDQVTTDKKKEPEENEETSGGKTPTNNKNKEEILRTMDGGYVWKVIKEELVQNKKCCLHGKRSQSCLTR